LRFAEIRCDVHIASLRKILFKQAMN